MLSASANKLSRLKEQSEEHVALITEELDPEGIAYIEVAWGVEYIVATIIHVFLEGFYTMLDVFLCLVA